MSNPHHPEEETPPPLASPPTQPPRRRGALQRRLWSASGIPLAPVYRYVSLPSGEMQETYRINFPAALTSEEIARIGALVLRTAQESADVGVLAVAKVDFTLVGTCELRFLCRPEHVKKRVEICHGLWEQINAIHPIAAIDWTLWDWDDDEPDR